MTESFVGSPDRTSAGRSPGASRQRLVRIWAATRATEFRALCIRTTFLWGGAGISCTPQFFGSAFCAALATLYHNPRKHGA